jgi:predicted permease
MRVNRAAAWSRDSISRFYDVALDRLRGIPGVTNAAIADCSPESNGCDGGNFLALDGEAGSHGAPAGLHWITPDWADVLRVPVLHGRAIGRSDGPDAPHVAMVSEKAAREFWPTGDPIGKRLVFRGRDTVRVVGVVGDVRFYGLQTPPRPEVYVSYYQFPMSFRMMIHLRTRGDPAAVAEVARRALRDVAPGFPVYDVATMENRVGGSLSQSRFLARLLSVFALLALVLATIGTYGVISYGVAQRTREMGVRIALGATKSDVVRLVIRQGIVLAIVGGSLGVAAALGASRWLRSLLYDVEPGDPATLIGILMILLAAVVIASWIPARRAAKVPAAEALRGG